MKIESVEDLKRIREEARKRALLREGRAEYKVTVYMGTCGIAAGARQVMAALLDEIAKRSLSNVLVTQAGCIGLCDREPLVGIEKGEEKILYGDLTAERVRQIVASHLVNGQIIGDWVVHAERR
ncbi:MAG: (2Fe-2S) ferredoxin domain-containing protein [Candidatus Caldatribacteriaceae bacterium]